MTEQFMRELLEFTDTERPLADTMRMGCTV